MATVHGNTLPGDHICSTKMLPPKSVPSWGMYLISGGCALLASLFVIMAIDTWMQNSSGTAPAVAIAMFIGLIFVVCAIAAFLSGWKTQEARDVRFHSEGVVIASGEDETFFPYADLNEIEIQLIDPSSGEKANQMVRAALSLAAGHAAGIGSALGKTVSTGIVQIKIPNEVESFVFQFDLDTAKRIAEEANRRRP